MAVFQKIPFVDPVQQKVLNASCDTGRKVKEAEPHKTRTSLYVQELMIREERSSERKIDSRQQARQVAL
jgi:hypothetical protein